MFFCLCSWIWLFPFLAAGDVQHEPAVARFIETGGFISSADGSIAAQLNSDTPYIPASIIKIATALVALEVLGPSFRYKTEFYIRDKTTLYIRGSGDPFLVSEFVAAIARELKDKGIERIDRIVIDDSRFNLPTAADGSTGTDNPYDAPNSALAVNFNSLAIQVNADTGVATGEFQTPLLPLSQAIGRQLPPGQHRVNVSSFASGTTADINHRYVAELFAAFLRKEGLDVGTALQSGTVDTDCVLIYTFINPKSVREIVEDCLKFSNNFIANQLFLSCGAARFGYPATWEKGRQALRQVLTEQFLVEGHGFDIHEGSGLSRRTRVTPRFMMAVLEAFKPYRHLLPGKETMLIKSGTLTDVYCYAGYFNSRHASDPFVIMLNQPQNTRQIVLEALHHHYLLIERTTY